MANSPELTRAAHSSRSRPFRSFCLGDNVWADPLDKTLGRMLVHYEDLKRDPALEVRRCLDLLGFRDVADESIATGVEQGRFSKMQRQAAHPEAGPG